MSAVEFALKPKTPFIHTLPQLPFEKSLTGSDVLTARYEGLFRLSRSIASMTPEVLSRNLVALFRPLFPCDLINIIIFNQRDNGVSWESLGEAQLARMDVPVQETTVWSVYREQRPLWIVDWQHDQRPV